MVDSMLARDAATVQSGGRVPWVRWETLGDGKDYPVAVEFLSERERCKRSRTDVTGPYPSYGAALAVVRSGEARDEPGY